MRTCVVEGFNRHVFLAHDHQRLPADGVLVVAARVRNLLFSTRDLPHLSEQSIQFELQVLGIDVSALGYERLAAPVLFGYRGRRLSHRELRSHVSWQAACQRCWARAPPL